MTKPGGYDAVAAHRQLVEERDRLRERLAETERALAAAAAEVTRLRAILHQDQPPGDPGVAVG